MADLPSTVTVGAHTFTILADADTARHTRNVHERGQCDVDGLTIRVDNDLPPSQLAETVLHEVLHAVWGGTGLAAIGDLDSHEEHVIRSLAALLYDTLRSNPGLVKYLTA
jgi:hypothetical protein